MPTSVTRAPTSDVSITGSWTGSSGSRYTLVDDYPDGSSGAPTDYAELGTAASTGVFGFSSITLPSETKAGSITVYVEWYDAEPSSGTNRVYARVKAGGTEYDHSSYHNPSGITYTSRSYSWANNPKTGSAWTKDDINGVGSNTLTAFGVNGSDCNPVFRIASIRLRVDYTCDWPAACPAQETETCVCAATLTHASWAAACAANETETCVAAATLTHADWAASGSANETETCVCAAELDAASLEAECIANETETCVASASLTHADWAAGCAAQEYESCAADATLIHVDNSAECIASEVESCACSASLDHASWYAGCAASEYESCSASATINHADWAAECTAQEQESAACDAALTAPDWPAECLATEREYGYGEATLSHAEWLPLCASVEYAACWLSASLPVRPNVCSAPRVVVYYEGDTPPRMPEPSPRKFPQAPRAARRRMYTSKGPRRPTASA